MGLSLGSFVRDAAVTIALSERKRIVALADGHENTG